jgi:hypothetical protein
MLQRPTLLQHRTTLPGRVRHQVRHQEQPLIQEEGEAHHPEEEEEEVRP